MTPLVSCAYFPPVAWVAAVLPYDHVWIEVKETFPKQTFRNRVEIMTAEGVRTLSVPTLRSNHTPTDEVGIDYSTRWPMIHLRTLRAAYAASPYFLYYCDDLEAILSARYDTLVDLDMATCRWLLDKLKVECNLMTTTDFAVAAPLDWRNRFTPKSPLPANLFPSYYQVFADRQPFAPNLSALDLLMNLGPDSGGYLRSLSLKWT